MKICQTCGKSLKAGEVFTLNGIVQCEECAYSKQTPNQQNKEISKVAKGNKILFQNTNKWANSIKQITRLNIIFGIIISCALGIAIGMISVITFGLPAFVGVLIGLVVLVIGIVSSLKIDSVLMMVVTMAEDISIIKQIENDKYMK